MSSHHIIRDEQEPALLLWEPAQATIEQAGQLLEWSPQVLVHEQALPEVIQWGIKIDAVWALPQGLQQISQALEHQQPLSLLPLPETAPLKAVLQWLKKKNQRSLNLLANAAAEDFMLLRQLEQLQENVQVQVISQGWRYSYFSSGRARKWLPTKSGLRLLAFNDQPVLSGVKASTVHEQLPVREFCLEQDGVLSLEGASPFWLGEKL